MENTIQTKEGMLLPASDGATSHAVETTRLKAAWVGLRKSFLLWPLLVFLVLMFIIPLLSLLTKSVENTEVHKTLPLTVKALKAWDGKAAPSDEVYRALASDLEAAEKKNLTGTLAKRLNMEQPGYLMLVSKTAMQMPLDPAPDSYKAAITKIDPRWGEPDIWLLIQRNSHAYTPYYWLAAIDKKVDGKGSIVSVDENQAVFVNVLARTFWMSLVITVWSLVLAYPLAYFISKQSARTANLLMICVLLPFWTSILVRVAAWIILLQNGGIVNSLLMALHITDEPVPLVFNRIGVYISMVHILLPFMVLPICSSMKSISPSYMRAAASLGCHPFEAFWRVYFPQTLAGVGAGALLVFIMAMGYYITPALLGGQSEQMIGYFVAFYTNRTINWGMATALGGLLLAATLVLYTLYSWLVGSSKVKLG